MADRPTHAPKMREYRQLYRRQGYCLWCPQRAVPGQVLCDRCRQKNALRQAQLRARKKGRPIPEKLPERYYIERNPDAEED